MSKHPDSPVPQEQELACTLWKCHYTATQGWGDGSVTWWTLQPVVRMWWLETAKRFAESAALDALIARERAAALREAADAWLAIPPATTDGPIVRWLHDRADAEAER